MPFAQDLRVMAVHDASAMLIGEISSASGLDTAVAWGPGTGNFFGVRPLVWRTAARA